MSTKKYTVRRIILLFVVVLVTGCHVESGDRADPDLILLDGTPAQFVEAYVSENGRSMAVYFDRPPRNVRVHGAKHYALLGTTLEITTEKCETEVVVFWEGGQRTFTDRCPFVAPPPATEVGVEPPPNTTIPPNQQFSLDFNLGVTSATVNGVAAAGAGRKWTATPGLKEGTVILAVEWTSRDGSTRSQLVGPYTVQDE